jgi:D-psicose/D-tagatose/L-ribulose 3-epimerase
MRLAISNLAWEAPEDEAVAALLRQYAIDAIDVAPSRYFPDIRGASDAEVAVVRDRWAARGVAITGMQSLLFGTSGLNVFGPPQVQDAMLDHLDAVCRIGAGLGAARLVFGSPRNRDRLQLSPAAAADMACDFFRRLGERARKHGVLVCLEPNPERYGANFMTTSAETAEVVRQVDHAHIRMQLDVGALAINGEDAQEVLANCAGLVGHIHASEPDLLPLGDGDSDHPSAARAIARYLPGHVVTIEMLATATEPHPRAIERALAVAARHYLTAGPSE